MDAMARQTEKYIDYLIARTFETNSLIDMRVIHTHFMLNIQGMIYPQDELEKQAKRFEKILRRKAEKYKVQIPFGDSWGYKESQSLKRFAKMRFDKEHKDSLSKYPELKERMQSLLQNGEKITPKQWKAEIQSLQSEYDSIGREQTKTATELAYAEVISYNKKNLERELQNESRQQNRQQSRTKRREEEIYCKFYCKDKRFFV